MILESPSIDGLFLFLKLLEYNHDQAYKNQETQTSQNS